MPGVSYRRRLGSLLMCLCDVFRALINSLVCWFFMFWWYLLFLSVKGFGKKITSWTQWPGNDTITWEKTTKYFLFSKIDIKKNLDKESLICHKDKNGGITVTFQLAGRRIYFILFIIMFCGLHISNSGVHRNTRGSRLSGQHILTLSLLRLPHRASLGKRPVKLSNMKWLRLLPIPPSSPSREHVKGPLSKCTVLKADLL